MNDPESIDVYKTLLELDPEGWDPECLDEAQAAVLRHIGGKPLRRFTAADFYHAVHHNLGLPYIAPLAIERLRQEPLLEAAQYPGDLLVALMESNTQFWLEEYSLWLEMIGILGEAVATINARMESEERADYVPWHLGDDFMAALLHFRGIHRCGDGGT